MYHTTKQGFSQVEACAGGAAEEVLYELSQRLEKQDKHAWPAFSREKMSFVE